MVIDRRTEVFCCHLQGRKKSGLTIEVTPLSYAYCSYFIFHLCIFLITSFIILFVTVLYGFILGFLLL